MVVVVVVDNVVAVTFPPWPNFSRRRFRYDPPRPGWPATSDVSPTSQGVGFGGVWAMSEASSGPSTVRHPWAGGVRLRVNGVLP